MHEIRHRQIQRLIAVIGLTAFFYPLAAVLRFYGFGQDEGAGNAFAVFLFTPMVFIYLQWISGIKARFPKTLVMYVSLLIPLGVVAFLYHSSETGRLVFEAVIISFFYFMGARGFLTENWSVLNGGMISPGILALAAALSACLWYRDYFHFRPMVMICIYISMVCTLYVKNQEKVEWVFDQKGVDAPGTIHKIKRFNTLLIAVFFLLLMVLVNVKLVFQILFEKVFGAVGWTFKSILHLIIVHSDPSVTSEKHQPIAKHTAPIFRLAVPEKPSLFDLCSMIFLWFIILYLLYKILPILFVKVRGWITGVFGRIRIRMAAKGSGGGLENEEFVDRIESLNEQQPAGRVGRAKYRKARKRENAKDPVLRVRQIYAGLIQMLLSRGVEIRQSDTPGEICRKALSRSSTEECLLDVTRSYEEVRYGEKVPDALEVGELEQKYRRIHEDVRHYG